MRKFKIETKDFDAKNTLECYRVILPKGHCQGNHVQETVIFQMKPHTKIEEIPGADAYGGFDPLDEKVISEKVKLFYPDFIEGAVNEASLIHATTTRALGYAVNHAKLVEDERQEDDF